MNSNEAVSHVKRLHRTPLLLLEIRQLFILSGLVSAWEDSPWSTALHVVLRALGYQYIILARIWMWSTKWSMSKALHREDIRSSIACLHHD